MVSYIVIVLGGSSADKVLAVQAEDQTPALQHHGKARWAWQPRCDADAAAVTQALWSRLAQ